MSASIGNIIVDSMSGKLNKIFQAISPEIITGMNKIAEILTGSSKFREVGEKLSSTEGDLFHLEDHRKTQVVLEEENFEEW